MIPSGLETLGRLTLSLLGPYAISTAVDIVGLARAPGFSPAAQKIIAPHIPFAHAWVHAFTPLAPSCRTVRAVTAHHSLTNCPGSRR